MNRRRFLLSALVCIFAFAALGLVIAIPSQIVDYWRPTNQITYSFTQASQSFVAPANGLSSVGLFLDLTRAPRGTHARLALMDQTGRVLRSSTRALQKGDPIPIYTFKPTYFGFAPIPHSKGRLYRAAITVSSPGIALWGAQYVTYPAGAASIAGVAQPFDFSFATRHQGSLSERIHRLSRWAPLWLVLGAAAATLALTLACGAVGVQLRPGV